MRAQPSALYQSANIWRRNFLQFRKSWMVSLFWILLEPAVILGAVGLGLGAYIVQVQGRTYLEFFFPALLCTSSMMVAFFESTYGYFTKLSHLKTYSTICLAPIEVSQLVAGEILWAATKGTLSAVGISIVALPFGVVQSPWMIAGFVVIFIATLVFSAMGMIVTSMVKNYDAIIYPTSGLIVPMSLLCGTYFPLEGLPTILRYVMLVMPLTHEVALIRAWQFGNLDALDGARVGYLLLLFVVLYKISVRNITRRLVD